MKTMKAPLLEGYKASEERLESCILVDGSPPDREGCGVAHKANDPDDLSSKQNNSVNLRFLHRLARLMVLAQAQGALLLVALSILEVLVIAQVGIVPGLFYKALLDNNVELFATAMWRSLLWYGSAAICAGVKLGVSEMLALQWRKRLTHAAHSRYCQGSQVYRLMRNGAVDNPDQRVAQEIQLFSTGLAQLLYKTVVCPLMIAYYTVLVWTYVGWKGPVAVYLFFSVGTLGARCLISPIAALVAKQEKLEGDFRVAHVRLRTNAEQVALYDSSRVERTTLNSELTRVLTNQRALVIRHTILELGSKAYDYMGSILNYAILAVPIFVGIYGKGGPVDKGAVAQLVSNASFAVLTLIYSFTQLIDAAKVLSDVAGVTGRVAGLFEALEKMDGTGGESAGQPGEKSPKSKQGPGGKGNSGEASLAQFLAQSVAFTPSLPGLKDNSPANQFRNPYPWVQNLPNPVAPAQAGSANGLLLGPMSSFVGGNNIEYSIHRVPAELRGVLQEVFPGQGFPGLWTQPLLVVPSFQCARTDLWGEGAGLSPPGICNFEPVTDTKPGPSMRKRNLAQEERCVSDEMARLGDVFLRWQAAICSALREEGFWAGAVDPRTGFALTLGNPEAVAQQGESRPADPNKSGGSRGSGFQGPKDRVDGASLQQAEPALKVGFVNQDAGFEDTQLAGECSNMKHAVTTVGSPSKSPPCQIGSSWECDSLDATPQFLKPPTVSTAWEAGNLTGDSSFRSPATDDRTDGRETNSSTASRSNLRCRETAADFESPNAEPVAYSEVHGAEVLLGYETGTSGTCPVVFHPRFGARAYPASLFTNAPLEVLKRAVTVAGVRDSEGVDALRQVMGVQGLEARDAPRQAVTTAGVQGFEGAESAGAFESVLELQNLTVLTPGGVLVVRGLELRIGVRERVMLMGPSGCGKTTLVQTISGLWPRTEGTVRIEPRSAGSGTLYLPQTPLLARGGLAAQLAYPQEVPTFTAEVERRMQEALAVVDLENLLLRVDWDWKREEEWPAILSPGEQQRLSLARVLFHRPHLAVIDEATSAIGEALEARIYEHLALLPTSLLTISHRHTLKRWHAQVVHILGDGQGSWVRDRVEQQ